MAIASCKLHLLLKVVALSLLIIAGSGRVASTIADNAFELEVNIGHDHEAELELHLQTATEGKQFAIMEYYAVHLYCQ